MVALLALSLAACGGHSLKGTMTLYVEPSAGVCINPGGGYSDIHEGTNVTVRDEAGKILATGALQRGHYEADGCVYDFEVSDLPDTKFYQVEVSHRGEITYSEDELNASGWNVALELGSLSG